MYGPAGRTTRSRVNSCGLRSRRPRRDRTRGGGSAPPLRRVLAPGGARPTRRTPGRRQTAARERSRGRSRGGRSRRRSLVALERQTCGQRPASCSLLVAVRVAKDCERVARRVDGLVGVALERGKSRLTDAQHADVACAPRGARADAPLRRRAHASRPPVSRSTRYPRPEGNRAPAAPCRRLPPAAPLPCGCAAAPRRIVPRSLRRGDRPEQADAGVRVVERACLLQRVSHDGSRAVVTRRHRSTRNSRGLRSGREP